MDAVNLKKLAEQLNLSIATVSKALRDRYEVNEETKKRVRELAQQLNYQPNPYASSLRKQKSNTIAVILPEIANNFFTLAINGIESVAHEKGYHVLIYLTHEDYAKEVAFTNHLQSGRVDGILMSLSDGHKDASHLQHLQEKGIPIVFFDRINEDMPTTKVTTDDYESGYKATAHLIEQGCMHIALLVYSKGLSIAEKRMEGYIQALKDHGLPVKNKLIVHCTDDRQKNFALIEKLLKSKNRPDGIFSAFEKYAIIAYELCEKLKISIPEDIKIVSFSNLETASLLNPSLTTITQPAFDMGQKAASVLFEALRKNQSKTPDEHIVLQSTLVQRHSTRL